ncbi:MAG: DUF2064 domain-containing protein [Flavobacteriaceae bacterium]
MKKKTAILIFAQSASLECKNKYFPKGLELFSELNNQALKIVEKTGLPYFIFSENNQKGDTFGERYTNAIEAIFNKGFLNVITIGNDCPELNTSQLLQAAQNLNESKTTLGPTLDGGFYLLAFHKNIFDKKAFLKLPWQKKSLRKELIKVLESKKAVISGFCYYNDLDNQNDIRYYLAFKNKVSGKILNLIQTFTSSIPNDKIWFFIEKNFISILHNKGSPIVS